MGGHATAGTCAFAGGRFQLTLVFVIVAVQAQQFPVAAVGRIVVVIVIPVVNGQFSQVGARELAGAAPADPGIDLQRLLPVAELARLGRSAGFRHDAVQFAGVTCAHEIEVYSMKRTGWAELD